MNTNQFTQKTMEALQAAQRIAVEYANNAVEQEHLLAALAQQQDGLIPQLLTTMGADPNAFAQAAMQKVEELPRVTGSGREPDKIYIGTDLDRALNAAEAQAKQMKDEYVSVEHVFLGILQRPGKANQIRPMEEWIVAVGKHPGIIAGSDWVRVQAMLDVNKSKSYRRPRSNVALLSGLLRCGECGDYMRPKLTNRRTADGELIYTYMCSTKERSHGTVCSMKNCNGNTLDAKIIEEIRKLSADKETLTRLLAQTKKVISGSKEGYDAELALLREKHTETEDRIKRLVESLSVASDTSAKYVMEQIDALHQESETQQMRLSELEALTEQSRMLHQEFAFHQEMIESFASAVDSATLEEKRRLLRTIVKKVVWDGKNAYVYLFAEDGEADLPPIDQPMHPLGEDSE